MNHDKSVDTISKNCNLNNISYYKSNDIQFLLFYIPFLFITLRECMKFLFKFIYSFNYEFKELVIVRGVPGSGKNYYVMNRENGANNEYLILNIRDYFKDENDNFNFNGKELGKAENYILNKLLLALTKDISYIYIVGFFEKKWMYKHYIRLAKIFNYKVNIVEIDCPDLEHLHYFNQRSEYNTPINRSKLCYDSWEYDSRSVIVEPYIPKLPGDSLPSINKLTKKDLDDDLDAFLIQRDNDIYDHSENVDTKLNKHNSDSEEDSDEDEMYDSSDEKDLNMKFTVINDQINNGMLDLESRDLLDAFSPIDNVKCNNSLSEGSNSESEDSNSISEDESEYDNSELEYESEDEIDDNFVSDLYIDSLDQNGINYILSRRIKYNSL